MRRFARLCAELEAGNAGGDALAALRRYLDGAPAEDAAWALHFLAGGRARLRVPAQVLRQAACRRAGIDEWLFDECLQAVGDLAETIVLLLPAAGGADPGLARCVEQHLLPLRGLAPPEQGARLIAAWDELDADACRVFVKLAGGGFRAGASPLLLQQALAARSGLDGALLAQRLALWRQSSRPPSAARLHALLASDVAPAEQAGRPYPFAPVAALPAAPAALGEPADWLVEWQHDGQRAQIVRRAGAVWIWSPGEQLVTARFPEVAARAAALPDGTVLDGELLPWPGDTGAAVQRARPQPRVEGQTPAGRRGSPAPADFVARDLLEQDGVDLRPLALHERRHRLEVLLADLPLRPSLAVAAADWAQLAALRASARQHGAVGLVLRRRALACGGRGEDAAPWWTWPVDALSVQALLVNAEVGRGRGTGLRAACGFAVWSRPPRDAAEAQAVLDAIARREPAPAPDAPALHLLPIARLQVDIDGEAFAAVQREIALHTLQRFGPVRSLLPALVVEIGFAGLAASPRHKSGLALRDSQLLRIRPDRRPWQADALPALRALLDGG